MGEGERPDITNIKIGTVNDFDSIETPMTHVLSLVPKDKYDELEEKYNDVLCRLEHCREKAEVVSHEKISLNDKLRAYETTIRTLAEVLAK